MGNTTNDLLNEVTLARTSFLSASEAIASFTSSLSISANSFVTLMEKIEAKAKEVTEKEKELKVMEERLAKKTLEAEDMLAKKTKELEEKQLKLEKKEEELQKKADLILECEKKWDETQKRMAANAAKFPDLVEISVGGKYFVLPKTILRLYKGSYFESMLTTDYPQLFNGKYYIDYSPKHFKLVVEFLRNQKLPEVDTSTKKEIQEYFKYFSLPNPYPLPVFYDMDEYRVEGLETYIKQHFPSATKYTNEIPSPCIFLTVIIVQDRIDTNKWIPICKHRTNKSGGEHYIILVCNIFGDAIKAAPPTLNCKQLFKVEFGIQLQPVLTPIFLPQSADAAVSAIKTFMYRL